MLVVDKTRVQTTINHISNCFYHYINAGQRNFFSERAEKGIARHIDVSRGMGSCRQRPSNFDWFVLSMRIKLSWTLFSPVLVQPRYGAGRKESSGTGLPY